MFMVASRFFVLMAGDYSELYCKLQHHKDWASRTDNSRHNLGNLQPNVVRAEAGRVFVFETA